MAEPIPNRRPPRWRLANELSWRSRPGRRRILVIALTALLIGSGIWWLFGRGSNDLKWSDEAPKWSPDGKRIVFESTRNDPKGHLYSIYVMNADGSGLRELARPDAELPTWSPDGRRIVYVQGQLNYDHDVAVYGGGGRIMVMRADGSGKTKLALSGSTDDLSWSPDGRWIAYEGDIGDPNLRSSVYIVRPDGSGRRRIARDAFSPSWSPDGKRLAFSSGNGDEFSDHTIDVLRISSGERIEVTTSSSSPSPGITTTWPIVWSPDGFKLAFVAGEAPLYVGPDVPDARVYVVNADGSSKIERPISQAKNLYDISVTHGLAWLPGSRDRVIYYSPKGAFVSSIRSGHDRLLNDQVCCAAEPSPDGKKILYVESSSGAIFVAPIAGRTQQRLTQRISTGG